MYIVFKYVNKIVLFKRLNKQISKNFTNKFLTTKTSPCEFLLTTHM